MNAYLYIAGMIWLTILTIATRLTLGWTAAVTTFLILSLLNIYLLHKKDPEESND